MHTQPAGLEEWRDGRLHGREAAAVEDHLSFCRECRAEVEALDALCHLLWRVDVPEAPPTLWERMEALIDEETRRRERRRWWAWISVTVAATAVGAAAMALT